MANDKQKALKHGTHEILIGAEWDIAKQLTISGGYQRTDYGLADDFQSDISFFHVTLIHWGLVLPSK